MINAVGIYLVQAGLGWFLYDFFVMDGSATNAGTTRTSNDGSRPHRSRAGTSMPGSGSGGA